MVNSDNNNLKCFQCGERGHKEILTTETHITEDGRQITIENIPTLECVSCGSHSYEYSALEYITAKKEQSAGQEIL